MRLKIKTLYINKIWVKRKVSTKLTNLKILNMPSGFGDDKKLDVSGKNKKETDRGQTD